MQEDNEGEENGMRSVTMAMNLGNVVRNYARTPLWKCGEEGLEIPSQLWPWRGQGRVWAWRPAALREIPGGALGWWTYDCGRHTLPGNEMG